MNDKKIAFIGCGAMGSAIASALATKIDPQQILLSDTFAEKAEKLAETLGANFIKCPIEAVKAADWVILCTKPQTVEEVLHMLSPVFAEAMQKNEPKVLCSILAGVKLEKLASLLAVHSQAILRLMPNTPVLIGKGLGLLAANDFLTAEEKDWFLDTFAPCGELHFLEESYSMQVLYLQVVPPLMCTSLLNICPKVVWIWEFLPRCQSVLQQMRYSVLRQWCYIAKNHREPYVIWLHPLVAPPLRVCACWKTET